MKKIISLIAEPEILRAIKDVIDANFAFTSEGTRESREVLRRESTYLATTLYQYFRNPNDNIKKALAAIEAFEDSRNTVLEKDFMRPISERVAAWSGLGDRYADVGDALIKHGIDA